MTDAARLEAELRVADEAELDAMVDGEQHRGALGAPLDLARLEQAVQREVDGDRARLAALPTWGRACLAALLIAGFAALAFGVMPRPDLARLPPQRLLATLAVFALLTGAALLLALRPLHRPPPPRYLVVVWITSGLVLPFLVAAAPEQMPMHAASSVGRGAELWSHALPCFGAGSIVAVTVVMVVGLLDRGRQLAIVPVLGAALAGGLAANLALQLHCPITAIEHLLLGHALIVVFAAAANLIQRWVRRPRHAR